MDCNLDHAEAKGRQSDHAGSKRRKQEFKRKTLVKNFPGFLYLLTRKYYGFMPLANQIKVVLTPANKSCTA